MRIDLLTRDQLAATMNDAGAWPGEVLPISPPRLRSQVVNPRAEADDVVLLVAREGTDVVAYIGLLPDLLWIRGEVRRFAWISSWWVDTERAAGSVGALLLLRAHAVWKGQIAVAGFNDLSANVFEKLGRFLPLREDEGVSVFLRFSAQTLRSRLRSGPVSTVVAGVMSLLQRWRWRRWKNSAGTEIRVEALQEVDQRTQIFIENQRAEDLTRRGMAEIEWIIRHPWMETGEPELDDERYHFSWRVGCYEVELLRLWRGDDLVAVLLTSRRDRELKVPFLAVPAEEIPAVAEAVVRRSLVAGVERVTVYRPVLARYLLDCRWPFVLRRPAVRRMAFAKDLNVGDAEALALQDGEGDGVFT